MAEVPPGQGGSLPLSARVRADEACDRFDDAWKAGARPRLEDFLGDAQGPERAALLTELLRLELDHRRRAGEAPSAEEYLRRFPEHGPGIAAAWAYASPPHGLCLATAEEEKVWTEGEGPPDQAPMLAAPRNTRSAEQTTAPGPTAPPARDGGRRDSRTAGPARPPRRCHRFKVSTPCGKGAGTQAKECRRRRERTPRRAASPQ
jgi:hypothetical protein